STTPLQLSSLPLHASPRPGKMSGSASLQSPPPQTIGGCPSRSASRIENSHVAVAVLQRTFVLQGSSANRSLQTSSLEQTTPGTQPLPTSHCCRTGQTPSPVPGACRHSPKAQLSMVHGMPSSQSAAV